MLTAAPIPTETNGLTLGSVVLKLLAAMKEEKHAGGKAATASRNITHLATSLPSTTGIKLNESIIKLFCSVPAAIALALRSGDPYTPATTRIDSPAVTTVARATPTRPPIFTSFLSLLFKPKSTPAAPAVAKKPTT